MSDGGSELEFAGVTHSLIFRFSISLADAKFLSLCRFLLFIYFKKIVNKGQALHSFVRLTLLRDLLESDAISF